MSFNVKAGQTWKKEDVTIKILEIYVSKVGNYFAVFYKIEHTKGDTVTLDSIIDLHEQLEEWGLL